jgi:tetratricopeptide (TPR) repeat protein/tRNA A-37 threonylcarbamoyl transferase component Bud32
MSELPRKNKETPVTSVAVGPARQGSPASDMTIDLRKAGNGDLEQESPSSSVAAAVALENERTIVDPEVPGDRDAKTLPVDTAHDVSSKTLELAQALAEREQLPPPQTTASAADDISSKTLEFAQAPAEREQRPPAESTAPPADATGPIPEGTPLVVGDRTLEFDAAKLVLAFEHTIAAPPTSRGEREKTPEQFKAGPAVVGYELLGELGRGAMGVVYKARQKGLNRLVALKMMLAGSHAGPEQLARFQTEAQSVARLQNPNIVQIYEVGEHDGLPYFSLEFVDGGTLQYQLGGKTQPPKEAAMMIETLARAMYCAHELGIIHRDLKPANVLVTSNGILKISDFGLAKRLEDDSGQTRSGALMGTPSYMSPEQARGDTRDIGPAADQYALGAMLYEMITGRPPFQGASILDTLEQVRTHEPVPPSRLQPTVPRDLETICLRCLQKEIGKRYENTRALAEDLRRFQAGEPILARPVGKVERVWRWCKRNPKVAVLTGCVAALVLVAVGSAVVHFRNMARDAETVAETRLIAEARLQQAIDLVQEGNFLGAKQLLQRDDAVLASAADLQELRTTIDTLRRQIEVYAELKKLSDNVHFASRIGSPAQKKKGHEYCLQFLELFKGVTAKTGDAASGLPPLSRGEERLFKEDVFDVFLDAAQLEVDLVAKATDERHQAGDRKAIEWLNRAEQVLPNTRVVRVRRAASWERLENKAEYHADMAKAGLIKPTSSAVDRYWHGYADHLRALDARNKKKPQEEAEFFRREIAAYAAFLEQRPEHFWGYFSWALAQAEVRQLHDAMIGFTACIRLRPQFPYPYNNRGTVHLRLGEFEEAVRDYSTALELAADFPDALMGRALAYRLQGKHALALADVNKMLQIDKDHAPAFEERAAIRTATKDFDGAAKDLTRFIALTSDKIPALFKRAELYRKINKLAEALADYTDILTLKPDAEKAFRGRADVYDALKDYPKARGDLTALLDARPDDVELLRKRAFLTLVNLKDPEGSLEDWSRLVQLRPKDLEVHYLSGIVHAGLRRYGAALAELDTALQLKRDHLPAIWARAQIHLWQGQPAEALQIVEPWSRNGAPQLADTLNIRGDVLHALNRDEDATRAYRQVIQLNPKDPDAYVGLALVYGKQGKWDLARKCYDNLVAADTKSGNAYLRRAEFFRSRGQFAEAQADCKQAARWLSNSPLPQLLRASLQAAQGRYQEGTTAADKVLEHAPKDDGAILYAAAGVWSLAAAAAQRDRSNPKAAALANQYLHRAVTLLELVLDKGFHDFSYQEHNRMLGDPAMTALRLHSAGRDLLAHKSKE